MYLDSSVIWVLVADGGRAEIYRYHRNKETEPVHDPKYPHPLRHELTPVPGMALKAEPLTDFQVGPDGRGVKIGGKPSSHNTCEPHLDIHDEVQQNLVNEIAAKLKRACENKEFDHLVIVAGPKILGALRQHLDANTLKCVIAEIAKDFTNDKNDALLAHLGETLTSACVA